MDEGIDYKSGYNDEPVYFCSRCLSLKVIGDEDECWCGECGCTNIVSSSIIEWKRLKKKRDKREMELEIELHGSLDL